MDDKLNTKFEDLSGGMNTADMCAQCLCMKCHKGPKANDNCHASCMDCRGANSVCPINVFEKI